MLLCALHARLFLCVSAHDRIGGRRAGAGRQLDRQTSRGRTPVEIACLLSPQKCIHPGDGCKGIDQIGSSWFCIRLFEELLPYGTFILSLFMI